MSRGKTNYAKFLFEIKQDIAEGILDPDGSILILRSKKTVSEDLKKYPLAEWAMSNDKDGIIANYYPIIDWYYDDVMTNKSLAKDPTDTIEEIDDKKKYKKDFERDRPDMKIMNVSLVLQELAMWAVII
jgi:hypothetical protein